MNSMKRGAKVPRFKVICAYCGKKITGRHYNATNPYSPILPRMHRKLDGRICPGIEMNATKVEEKKDGERGT